MTLQKKENERKIRKLEMIKQSTEREKCLINGLMELSVFVLISCHFLHSKYRIKKMTNKENIETRMTTSIKA